MQNHELDLAKEQWRTLQKDEETDKEMYVWQVVYEVIYDISRVTMTRIHFYLFFILD